jgi:hypothetical protein
MPINTVFLVIIGLLKRSKVKQYISVHSSLKSAICFIYRTLKNKNPERSDLVYSYKEIKNKFKGILCLDIQKHKINIKNLSPIAFPLGYKIEYKEELDEWEDEQDEDSKFSHII